MAQDDILGQFPDCAQNCMQKALLQYCSQNPTIRCFCTTQLPTSLNFIFQCASEIVDSTCDRDTVWTVAADLCWEYPVSTISNTTMIQDSPCLPPPPPSESGSWSQEIGIEGPERGSCRAGESSKLSNGAITGIAISTVVALGMVARLITFIVRRQRSPETQFQVTRASPPQEMQVASPPPYCHPYCLAKVPPGENSLAQTFPPQ